MPRHNPCQVCRLYPGATLSLRIRNIVHSVCNIGNIRSKSNDSYICGHLGVNKNQLNYNKNQLNKKWYINNLI